MRRSSFAASLFFAALLAGCSGTGGSVGDTTDKDPPPNVLGNGSRVHDLVGPATWENDKDIMSTGCTGLPLTQNIDVTGTTIVAIDNYDETQNGALGNYYIQDTDFTLPEFSGMTVFGASFSPPDLRVAPGDVVDVQGSYDEFLGPSTSPFGECLTLPEFTGTLVFRFDAPSPTLPPKVIDATKLKTYADLRPYLGMLVELDDVTLDADGVNKSGRYSAGIMETQDAVAIANELYDVESKPGLHLGDHFSKVIGVVTYFYSFHIDPRSAADLVK